jgi:hypothetical protein
LPAASIPQEIPAPPGTPCIRLLCLRRDRQLIPARIAEAERAILNRVEELFGVDFDHIEEDLILNNALYALRNCVDTQAKAA